MYVPSTRNIISSYDVVFDESVSITKAYTSQTYAEAMAMRVSVSYTPYVTSLRGGNGYIITFTQFEGGNLLYETWDNAESGEKSDDGSIMQPLFSEEEMDGIDSVNESEDEPMSTDMLEEICDGSKSCPRVNKR